MLPSEQCEAGERAAYPHPHLTVGLPGGSGAGVKRLLRVSSPLLGAGSVAETLDPWVGPDEGSILQHVVPAHA